jgi:hypothetical protein
MTDEQGRYEIKGLPPLLYVVNTTAPGYGTGNVVFACGEHTGDYLKVETMVLKTANLSISGAVVDANGTPVEGVQVKSWGPGQPERQVTTDEYGAFTIEGVCGSELRMNARIGRLHGTTTTTGGTSDITIVLTEAPVFGPRPLRLPAEELPDGRQNLGTTGEIGPLSTGSAPNEIGPRIEFESEAHDFGQVPPGSKNTCEFKFRNTGDAMLSFGKIQTTCGCTVASLKKKEYAPGESGTIATTFTASKRPSEVSKRIYVNSNDKTRPRASLTIKASIVLWVNPEPDELSLLLKTENAGCPNITLTSIDGQPFAIKSISSPGNWLRAEFDPTVQTVKFVLEPKVDMEGLKGTRRGLIKIAVTHPKCDVVQIPYKFLPRFNISPTSIILRSVQPGAPVEKVLWISSNYNEDFEIESFSCAEETARVVSQHEENHRVKMQVEITPPPLADKAFFRDELHINVQDGEQFKVDVRGFYKMDKERRRPTRRAR